MYEVGILIFPNDVLDLAKVHNSSFFPLDCRPEGYTINERYFFVHFSSTDFEDDRAVPLEAKGDVLRVGGDIIQKPLEDYQTIAIEWKQIMKMARDHVNNIPADAELTKVQKKDCPEEGEFFHIFRLVFTTHSKENLQFDENGKPRDFRLAPRHMAGKVTGELRYFGHPTSVQ